MQYYPKYFDHTLLSEQKESFIEGTFIVDDYYNNGYVKLKNDEIINISDGLQGINRAFTNNNVIVKVINSENDEKKKGKIINCKQQPLINLPGVLKLDSQTIHGVSKKKQRIYPFKPLDSKYPEFMVASYLQPGKCVYITINFDQWVETDKYPKGNLNILIGEVDILENQQKIMLYRYNLNPKKLKLDENITSQLNKTVNLSEDSTRINYKQNNIMSIDPENCVDVDDSFHLQKNKESNNYEIVVHIADVSSIMKQHTSFDNLILNRSFSLYFPGCNNQINMLPDKLVINSLSLNKDFERFAASVILKFDSNHCLVNSSVNKSVIINKNQLSYEEAQKIIENKPINKFRKNIELLDDLTKVHQILTNFRKNNKIESLNKFLNLMSDEIDSHELVQILMVLTNYVIGEKLMSKSFGIFRKHESKQNEQNKLVIENKELNKVYSNFQSNKATYTIVEQKDYQLKNYSHCALGLEHYTHFTSPIRRYFDVLVHRLLFEECSLEDFKNKIQLINNIEVRMKKYDKHSLRLFKISTMPKMLVDMKVYIIDFDISGKINVWMPEYNLIESVSILPKEIIDKVRIEILGKNNEILKISNEDKEIQLKMFQDVVLNVLPNLKEPNPKYKLKKSFVKPDFLSLID